eukprot:6175645-Pleurochrysis_carterae.AAC.2
MSVRRPPLRAPVQPRSENFCSRHPTGTCTGTLIQHALVYAPALPLTHALHSPTRRAHSFASAGECPRDPPPPTQTAALAPGRALWPAACRSDRGVSLPTQDVLVQNLSKESQESVHKAIREKLLPFARRHFPHLNAAFDKQPYPRPGNLFI